VGTLVGTKAKTFPQKIVRSHKKKTACGNGFSYVIQMIKPHVPTFPQKIAFTAYKNLPTCANINKSPPNERTGAAFFSNTGSDGKTAIDWLIVAQPKVREGRNGQRFTDCPTLRNAIHFAHKNPYPPGEILATMYLDPLGLTVTQPAAR